MSQSPGPLFVDIVNNTFKTYTVPYRNTTEPSLAGMFLGNTPPIVPDMYRDVLEEYVPMYQKNSWETSRMLSRIITASCTEYDYIYEGWFMTPLPSGAPPDVQAWWTAARSEAGIPTPQSAA